MKWPILESLALIAGVFGIICIPVALFIAIKGFLYHPMGWVNLALQLFVVLYFVQMFGARK